MRWTASATAPGGGFGRFALKAQTNVTGGNVSLSGVHLELDGNVSEGALTYLGNGRRTLQGTLAAETLDITPYLSTVRLLTGDDWNRRPIAIDDLNRMDLDLRLSAAAVKISGTKLGRTAVTVNLRGGDLSVAVGEAQAFGGIISGTFGLGSAAAGASFKAQLQFAEVDLDQCLAELAGVRRIEGKGTLGFNVNSQGASVFELTQTLNGTANLVSQGGVISGINVEQLLKRLERNPLAGRADFRNGKTPYDALTIALKVTQGVARVEELQFQAPAVRLTLAGSASIPARDLDLKGIASLLTSSAPETAGSFDLPFLVRGPWSDPLIWPDAQALIKRSGAAAPLLDAVRNRLAREPAKSAPEGKSTPAAAPAQ
jgi:AsmA protein